MKQLQETLSVQTTGRGFIELTGQVAAVVARSGVTTGLCIVFCLHTSASLLVQENADPDVRKDLLNWWARIAPEDGRWYAHDTEGPDDMPSHLRASIGRTSETIPVVSGRLALGQWQGIYLAEHRRAGQARSLLVHVIGEAG